jgi:AcrR family transcriptional regulator
MSGATKQRIIDAAIHLFNKDGVANVRLQQIADEAGISVGNLAYHYKNKEAIVGSVYENLFEEVSRILSSYMQSPSLVDFDQQLSMYYTFFSQYRFYLIDLFEVERTHPDFIETWRHYVSKMTIQIRKRLDYYAQRQYIMPEKEKGHYDLLAKSIWMAIVFWGTAQHLKGEVHNEQQFKEAVWSILSPYFTKNGAEEFAQIMVVM